MIFYKFFEFFTPSYLDDGAILVAREMGVFIDTQNLPMHTIMAMVKTAQAMVEQKRMASQQRQQQGRSGKRR